MAAYLASTRWQPDRVGQALTLAGLVTVLLQSPAGWLVGSNRLKETHPHCRNCRSSSGCTAFSSHSEAIGGVHVADANRRLGCLSWPDARRDHNGDRWRKVLRPPVRSQPGIQLSGKSLCRGLIAGVSHFLGGGRAIFVAAAILTIPTMLCTLSIHRQDIDPELARGGCNREENAGGGTAVLKQLFRNKVLLIFLVCAFVFHLANAAMLPQLGELLAHGLTKAAAPL